LGSASVKWKTVRLLKGWPAATLGGVREPAVRVASVLVNATPLDVPLTGSETVRV
jgi:hypothetical protein